MPSGLVLYEGPSKLNGKEIVVVATLKSHNTKTGNMIQTWILPKNKHPVEAVQTGYDECVCPCDLRGRIEKRIVNIGGEVKREKYNVDRSCYVINGFAPANVWKKYKRHRYPTLDRYNSHLIIDNAVRMGSAGDPSAVPTKVWHHLVKYAKKWSGFSSNWQNGHHRHLKRFCQASVYTLEQARIANLLGWHTFRISLDGKPDSSLKEVVCPGQSGKKQCVNCLLCNGNKSNVVVKVHGTKAKMRAFQKLIREK